MATLLFTAVGSLLGPLGGAVGALVGRQIDGALFGPKGREGPRLKELSVTTSSYGTPLARHFGRMRVPGSIIWATDLVEHRDRQGNGKGRPSTVTYSYSASFAVALASRPVLGVGRIWADGNLLRGVGGDLKAAGSFRLHTGERDQPVDPLIAAAEGVDRCPAFRGLAYAVFEDLQLGDFGNRIPALTFELIADEGELSLQALVDDVLDDADAALPLPGLAGFSCEGSLAEALDLLDPVFPVDCDAGGEHLVLARERLQYAPILLPDAAVSVGDGDFGGNEGHARKRAPASDSPPAALRYYDVERDYQPGLQRAPGRPAPGQPRTIELPAALAAADARALAEQASRRAGWARETLSWRTTTLDPAVAPGAIVAIPGEAGRWRVAEWEWRASGIELTLLRIPPALAAAILPTDPGRANPPADVATGATVLAAFELPWDGAGGGDAPAIFAAVSSPAAGWGGASLHVDHGDGGLVPLGPSGRARSVIGEAVSALPPASPHLFDRVSQLTVELIGPDMALADATARQLALGDNRALLGGEIIQFATAIPLGARRWRLEGLLRGRGGTEAAAAGHAAGETFVLLDGTPVALDAAAIGTSPAAQIVALGLGDAEPVAAAIAARGATLRPLTPVHARARTLADGSLELAWTRRARGGWLWVDGVDAPLHEQAEAYQLLYGPLATPAAVWELGEPRFTVAADVLAALSAAMPGGDFHVRQRGSYALSEPLLLTTLA